MAQCKNCSAKGLFLSVDNIGLCRSCSPRVRMDIAHRSRIIEDSIRIVETSKKLSTRLGRCDVIIEEALSLEPYQARGITAFSTSPSEIGCMYMEVKNDIIKNAITEELRAAQYKSSIATTVSGRAGPISKVLMNIETYKHEIPNPLALSEIEDAAKKALHAIHLNGYMDSAERAEMKRNKKKALEHYYDALYFLLKDDIDDRLQSSEISRIKERISALGGDPQ